VYGKDREKILKPKSVEPITKESPPITYTITIVVTVKSEVPVIEAISKALASRRDISEYKFVKVETLNDKS